MQYSPSAPRFAFFGTPYVARDTLVRLCEAGFVPGVVVTSPDAAKGRGLTLSPCPTKIWALEHGIPVLSPDTLTDDVLDELRSHAVELGIAVAYGKIIPQTYIDAFPLGIVNVHYSLLPKYRGASPVEYALWNGDTVTGVTVQQMVYRLDAGDILAQEELTISDTDTTLTLRPKLIELGSNVLIATLPHIFDRSAAAHAVQQDEAQATRAPKISKERGLLNLSADARTNWNTYRALRESPGTYFFAEKNGKRIRVKVTDAQFQNDTFIISRIIPEGKVETDFSYLHTAGWLPVSN